MKLIDKLEKKLGRYAIKNLTFYLIIAYTIGFAVSAIENIRGVSIYIPYMALDMGEIFRGEIWRLVTWIMVPPSTNVFLGLFIIYVYYIIGRNIEGICGDFRYNLFILGGLLLYVIAALISYLLFIGGVIPFYVGITPTNFNLSFFLAYVLLIPDATFLLFFIIPIKAWLLGAIYGVMTAYEFITAVMTGGYATCVEIFVALINLLIFYYMTGRTRRINPAEIFKKQAEKVAREQMQKRENLNKMRPEGKVHHKCAVCGKTDLDDPDLEFRYCSKCDGDLEYCSEHLFTHKHVVKDES